MPAKLTEKQIEALRNVDKWGEFRDAAAVTRQSLEKRGLVVFVEGGLTWALTNEGEIILRQHDGETETDLAIERCLESPNAEMAAPGVRIWNIVEPDPSDDETQELQPVQPDVQIIRTRQAGNVLYHTLRSPGLPNIVMTENIPITTTFKLYDKPEDLPKLTSYEQYKLAYLWERTFVFDGHSDVPDIGDVLADIAIAAHESFVARPDPDPKPLEPFIVRTWYKRLMDAKGNLDRISIWDNSAWNDAVLDFKLTKARYMSIAERFSYASNR